MVDLYDGRTGRWRSRDIPFPLEDELTLSTWTAGAGSTGRQLRGTWLHTVWRRTGQTPRGKTAYEFIGTVPSEPGANGDDIAIPRTFTQRWHLPLL